MLLPKPRSHKNLTIQGLIDIRGEHNRRRQTVNRHLLLQSGTDIPALGEVRAIYVVSMDIGDPAAKCGQVYLLVDVHRLSIGPDGHHECF